MNLQSAITGTMNRRSLLASLLAAGAVAALPGSEAHGAPDMVGIAPPPDLGPTPRLSSPAQAGLVYDRFSAIAFIPARTITYTSVPGGVQHSGATSEVFICPIGPDHQSTLKEVEVYVDTGPTAGASVLLVRFDSSGTTGILTSAPVPIAAGVQTVTLAVNHVVDIVDFDYELWVSYHNAGTLRGARIGSLPATLGLVAITPARAYDSRRNMAPDANGVLGSGANRTISVANARNVDSGAVIGPLVPSNATAIAYTLTVTNTVGKGYIAVNPGGVTTISASTINWWTSGSVLANTGVVKIDSNRTITAVAGGTGSTDLIIDVVGYYL